MGGFETTTFELKHRYVDHLFIIGASFRARSSFNCPAVTVILTIPHFETLVTGLLNVLSKIVVQSSERFFPVL